jgi:transposase
MIRTPDRETAVTLIDAVVTAGARRAKACSELEISDRTLRRWTKDGQVHADQRPLVQRPEPPNKLDEVERTAILAVCNSEEFASLSPSQIVPKLADQGVYLASESSFYRILRSSGQQHHRGRAKPPIRRKPPASFEASAPCPARPAQRALPGLDLGHNVAARAGRGHVFLPLSDRGHLQPQDRRLGSS